VQRASNVNQAVDNAVDSRRLQQRLDPQVRDIDITIDQDTDQYEIVDRRNNRVILQYRADDAADAGDKFNNWLRNQGMPADTENYGYRPLVSANAFERNSDRIDAIRAQQPQQVRMPNGVPVWELFDRETGSVLHAVADHNEREANSQARAWLISIGAEDPDTYSQRFAIRAKMLQPGERNLGESIDDAQKARNAMDTVAKEKGYANWSAVPPNLKISLMKAAVELLNKNPGHYNMLDKKHNVKEIKVTPVVPVRQDATRTKYNQVPRKDDPAPNPAVILKISPEALKKAKR
jgi:hypothetical protein